MFFWRGEHCVDVPARFHDPPTGRTRRLLAAALALGADRCQVAAAATACHDVCVIWFVLPAGRSALAVPLYTDCMSPI